ncbi:MAG: adaptor protein MecA [Clostridia bacterium]|nr:adaptor protein MecA [Clostridia bacterium]
MDIRAISSTRFAVGLSANDMQDLDITYDEMDYSNIETRRVIWVILDAVRQTLGRDIDPSGNLMIEAAPDNSGGCLLTFTVPDPLRCTLPPETVVTKRPEKRVYEFETADDLLDFMSADGLDPSELKIFRLGERFRIILCEHEPNVSPEEFGEYIGSDELTLAVTAERWDSAAQ